MRRFVRSLSLCLALCPGLGSASAQAQAEAPDVGARATLATLGCGVRDLLEAGGHWYAACGTDGVFVLAPKDGGLALVERRQSAGSAQALFVRDGRVWVEAAQLEARPLQELPAQGTSQAPVPPPVQGSRGTLPPPMLIPVPRENVPRRESKLWPERRGGYAVLEGAVRPLLPIGTRAFAALAEVAVGYYGERHWFVQGKAFPLGGIVGEGRDIPLFGASAWGGYDHPLFAIGVGVGLLTRANVTSEWTGQRTVYDLHQSTRFTVVQHGRFGALDGLHVALTNSFVLLDEWAFGAIEVRFQVPVVQGLWIVPAGSASPEAGFYHAELGLRKLLRGDRGSGSLFVRPSAGVAGIDKRDDDWNGMRSGPMVGVHLEWRQ